jgi:hypothetical protein
MHQKTSRPGALRGAVVHLGSPPRFELGVLNHPPGSSGLPSQDDYLPCLEKRLPGTRSGHVTPLECFAKVWVVVGFMMSLDELCCAHLEEGMMIHRLDVSISPGVWFPVCHNGFIKTHQGPNC